MANTGIYSQIRRFEMDDPLTVAAKGLQLKAAQTQVRQAEKAESVDAILGNALSQSGGSYAKAVEMLAAQGHGTAALELKTRLAKSVKDDLAGKLQVFEAQGSDAIFLDQAYRQALQAAGGNQQAAIAQVQPVYSELRTKWQKLGAQLPEQFDPMANFAYIGAAKENIQYLKSLAPEIKMTDTGGSITPMNVNPMAGPVGPLAGAAPIAKTASPAAPTELARLQQERDALPPGDPDLPAYDRAIAGYKAGKGDTNVTVNTGPMMPGKAGANEVDKDLLGVTRSIMQLNQIRAQFKPEYQRVLDKGGMWWNSVKDKAGFTLTNKEKKDLTEYSAYKRSSINALNEYIKSVTGAAMTEAEAQRILRGLPNPGQGLFDGDSPVEFQAKLDDALRQARLAAARLAYIKRRGMSLTDEAGNPVVSLEQMPALMKARARGIEEELRASSPKASDAEIAKARRQQLAIEFGLAQ